MLSSVTGSDAGGPAHDILDWFADLRSREAERRARQAGVFYGESPNVVARLIESGLVMRSALVLERRRHLLDDIDTRGADVVVLSDPELRDVVGFDMHRGVVGLFERPPPVEIDEIDNARIVCVVEGVGDDANIGAIVRSASALGADALVLDPTTADPFTRRAVRVSMGCVGLLPIVRPSEWPPAMPGRSVLAMTPSGDVEIGDVQIAGRVAVAVGSEGPGLSQAMLDSSDLRVRIDMGTGIESLSVSHAAAIALYQVRRGLSQTR